MLRAEAISKSYPTANGGLTVLSNVSLTLAKGCSAAIMGPSGSGKSTLLSIIGTLEPPTSGRVSIDGCDPFTLSPKELARFRNRRVGFIFQDHHLLPQCSVLENVLLPTLVAKSGGDSLPRARQLLDRVGLIDRLDHRPAELSGGEKQRVAIARALLNRPTLVLADEPTGNLDAQSAESIAELLAEMQAHDVILVVATHSLTLADRFQLRFELVDTKLATR